MAQDRDWATVYVRDEFGELLADLGLTDSTVDDWLAGVLDSTFRALSVAESDLATAEATDAQVPNALLLLDYYTLRKGVRALGRRVDTKTEAGLDRKRSQAFDHYTAELARAEKNAVNTGLVPAGDGAATFGRLTLDFLEPSLAEFG